MTQIFFLSRKKQYVVPNVKCYPEEADTYTHTKSNWDSQLQMCISTSTRKGHQKRRNLFKKQHQRKRHFALIFVLWRRQNEKLEKLLIKLCETNWNAWWAMVLLKDMRSRYVDTLRVVCVLNPFAKIYPARHLMGNALNTMVSEDARGVWDWVWASWNSGFHWLDVLKLKCEVHEENTVHVKDFWERSFNLLFFFAVTEPPGALLKMTQKVLGFSPIEVIKSEDTWINRC